MLIPEQFDKKKWFIALVHAWKAEGSILDAINEYLDGQMIDDWEGIKEHLGLQRTNIFAKAKPWFARKYRMASDALWQGQVKKAWGLFKLGEDTRSHEKSSMVWEQKRVNSFRSIRARELSKWHDWKTVK